MGKRGRRPLNDEFAAFGKWLVKTRRTTERAAPYMVKKARSIYRRLGKPLELADEEEVRALFYHHRGKVRGQYMRAYRLYREYAENLKAGAYVCMLLGLIYELLDFIGALRGVVL